MIGVNIAGAEFATNQVYPTNQEIDYYFSSGMDLIRIPFKWERLQPVQNGPLDQAELARLQAAVGYATGKGMKVVLDVHNFGQGFGGTIGSAATPNASFADLWSNLATAFKANSNVIFGLMNEPNSQTASDWIVSANAAIGAIRQTGATQQILVPGAYHSGAHDWISTDNDTVVGSGVVDPLNNYAIEVHQYLDADNSGTSRFAVSEDIGIQRLSAITNWAIQNHEKLFLGEFGVSNDPTAVVAMDRMLRYMEQNATVWTGASYWAGGSGWGDYMYSIEPKDLSAPVDKVQMDVLQKYDLDPTTPVPALSPPPPPPDGLAMARAPDSPSVINEGDTMKLTFTVRNAVAGQSFDFWQQGVIDSADFVRSLAQDFAAVLPAGASYAEIDPLRGTITLAAGTYSFTLSRQTLLDGVVETIDKASWADGNQENTDIRIGNFQGGLQIVSDTGITNWVTDRAASEPTPPPPSSGALLGTNNGETINGTNGGDAIYGYGGADILNGLNGDDTLVGGTGNDRLEGGPGSDDMWGEAGNDTYSVDSIGDRIHENFGGGTDTVNATISHVLGDNVENILLRTGASIDGAGNALNNRIEGNSGTNILSGGVGNDTLLGNGGNDTLIGGSGSDSLTGGDGADVFVFDSATDTGLDQVKDFGVGGDKIGVNAAAFGLSVGSGLTSSGAFDPGWFASSASATAAHGQFLYNMSTRALLWDADGTGAAAANMLATFNTGVTLQASLFTILGTPAPPTDTSIAIATADATKLEGSSGTTPFTFTVSRSGDVDAAASLAYAVSGAEVTGSDFGGGSLPMGTISFAAGETSQLLIINVAGDGIVENDEHFSVSLSAPSDGATITTATAVGTIRNDDGITPPPSNEIKGTDAAETLNGTSGDDHIWGHGGNDTLNGAAGNDIIEGGLGGDKINGNAGADSMQGGPGNDIYFVDDAGDQAIELAGEGTDVVNSDISFTLSDNIENLVLRTSAVINGTGNVLANRIEGNSAPNNLSGLDGNDTILGKGGNDVLSGGAGSDNFLFDTAPNATTNADRITDFAQGVDHVQLENAVFTGLPTTGPLSAAAFALGTAATQADDRIIYNQSSGALFYDADGNGATVQVQFASVIAGTNLTNLDILIV